MTQKRNAPNMPDMPGEADRGQAGQGPADPGRASQGQANQGEGNREADRHYRERTRDFVESGRVEEAARKARPESQREADEMRRAEETGRERAKEEDPAIRRGSTR